MYKEWEDVGVIGVDAGLCWIGDPCYILHKDEPAKTLGKDWGEFCSKLFEQGEHKQCKQWDYDLGHAGLGVTVSTGYGDGTYPVQVRKVDGRIAEVRVVFISDDDENDDF